MKRYETNDPFEIARYMNIQVVFMEFTAWMGLYTEIKGVKTIFINSNLSKILQKIVCSHELGHGQQTFKEAVFMKEHYLFGTNKLENEANQFAAEIIFSSEIDDEELSELDIKMLENLKKYL